MYETIRMNFTEKVKIILDKSRASPVGCCLPTAGRRQHLDVRKADMNRIPNSPPKRATPLGVVLFLMVRWDSKK